MCCGNDGPALEEIVMAEEERDHKVFTTTPTAAISIGHYGRATNDEPALVPASVAAELAGAPGLRIEAPAAAAEAGGAPVPEKKKARAAGQEE